MNPQPWPFPTAASHPPPSAAQGECAQTAEVRKVSESSLDHAIEESFPASDPVSVVATKVVPATAAPAQPGAEGADAAR